MMGFLLQLLYLPVRLALLPIKLMQTATTFVTCGVPLLVVAGIAAGIIWFLFFR